MTARDPWAGGELAARIRSAQNRLMADPGADAETIRTLAGQAYDAMERATRDDGSEYIRKRDDAPAWVAEIVQAAHGEMLPDDWRYACIWEAFRHIHDNTGHTDDLDETAHEFADDADVYNSDLLAWVGSHNSRAGYVDEARDEYGAARDFYHGLQMGQYQERAEVFSFVLAGLRRAAQQEADA